MNGKEMILEQVMKYFIRIIMARIALINRFNDIFIFKIV